MNITNDQTILLAIIVSSVATYFCRSLGVIFSSKLNEKSWVFDWIKCITVGIIVSVVSKIIFFPEGILAYTSFFFRLVSSFSLILIYYFFGKNILLSVSLSTLIFTLINYFID